jgi:hypothetical protein
LPDSLTFTGADGCGTWFSALWLGAAVILVVVVALAIGVAKPGTPTAPPSAAASLSSVASVIPSAGVASPFFAVVPTPPSPYSFDDEFRGSGLDPVWAQHFTCCGQLAGIDPSLPVVSNGMLSLGVAHQADGWYGSLIDTEFQWSQQYGHFAARIKVPVGTGLWPAFWGYASGGGPQSEIDTMEVCPGSAAATALHTSVHWSGRGSQGHLTQTVDLAQDFHVYAVDWRADHVTFSLDGAPVWTFTDASHARRVAADPRSRCQRRLLWTCGRDHPSEAQMLVDRVRAEP